MLSQNTPYLPFLVKTACLHFFVFQSACHLFLFPSVKIHSFSRDDIRKKVFFSEWEKKWKLVLSQETVGSFNGEVVNEISVVKVHKVVSTRCSLTCKLASLCCTLRACVSSFLFCCWRSVIYKKWTHFTRQANKITLTTN